MKKKILGLATLCLVLFFAVAPSLALAAPSSTPAQVLESVVDEGIDQSLSLVQVVMTTYWGYIIVFFIIVGLLGLAKKFGKLGSR